MKKAKIKPKYRINQNVTVKDDYIKGRIYKITDKNFHDTNQCFIYELTDKTGKKRWDWEMEKDVKPIKKK